jgi:hypothetical protein
MELFSLGEGHEYTEDDIKEAARALTGYTFDDDVFRFRPEWHDGGAKRILGSIGQWDGDDLCAIILKRRAVSEHICLKLYRFFVNDLPGGPNVDAEAFIIRLARRLRERNYNLKPVLKTLFKSTHFYDDVNVASQIKSPIQLIVQAVRSLRTPTRNLRTLLAAADLMGQNIFFPPSVKGWDGGRSWINTSTLFLRQNLMIYLLTGRRPGLRGERSEGPRYDATNLIDAFVSGERWADAHDIVTYLLRFNLGREPSPERVETLVALVNEHNGRMDNVMLIALLSLIAAMPEYQLC